MIRIPLLQIIRRWTQINANEEEERIYPRKDTKGHQEEERKD